MLNKGLGTHTVLVHCSALAQRAVWIGTVSATDISLEDAQEQEQAPTASASGSAGGPKSNRFPLHRVRNSTFRTTGVGKH